MMICCLLFQKLQSDLSDDCRMAELMHMVKQLPVNVASDEYKMLTDSVDEINKQHADTVQQVAARQKAVDERLSQWNDFDNSYHKLIAAISALNASVDDTHTLPTGDAIVKIEQVSTNICK